MPSPCLRAPPWRPLEGQPRQRPLGRTSLLIVWLVTPQVGDALDPQGGSLGGRMNQESQLRSQLLFVDFDATGSWLQGFRCFLARFAGLRATAGDLQKTFARIKTSWRSDCFESAPSEFSSLPLHQRFLADERKKTAELYSY